MIKLIKYAEIYAPEYLGRKDLLIIGDRIGLIDNDINLSGYPELEVIDARGKYLVPGFIDNHVHITGGGGEGGFKTRTPEIELTDITSGGVTTVVGCLGTDGTTRTMTNLLAKAHALEEEGITTYIYTGSYQLPVKTLTGSVQRDIILIDKIIGVGELALSDHRSSQPTKEDLTRVTAEARVGGILAGKAGILNIHLGDGKGQLDYLEEIAEQTEIPLTQFLPTHMSRNSSLFYRAIQYGKKGGLVDFTTSTAKEFLEEDETKCSKALKIMLEEGVSMEQITFSSDGQGSLPDFSEDGRFLGLKVGKVTSLYQEVRDAIIEEGIEMEIALRVITSNPASILDLGRKGRILKGRDADLVLLDRDNLQIRTVIARGQTMIRDGEVVVKGSFQ